MIVDAKISSLHHVVDDLIINLSYLVACHQENRCSSYHQSKSG